MLALRTLGSVELVGRTGRPLRSVQQDKRLALLAYLAANDRVDYHRRDKLLVLFWPEFDQVRARHALRQSLYYLRQRLGPQAIAVRSDDVGVGRVWCDAPALRLAVEEARWQEAVELYRGEFLEGFHPAGMGEEFEQWLQSQRVELRQLAARAANALLEAAERRGDLAGAADWARKVMEINPLDETSLRRLVVLLDRAGHAGGAVAAYDAFAMHLRNEYDLQPAAETSALIAAVRARKDAGQVNAAPAPSGSLAAGAPVPAPGIGHAQATVVLESAPGGPRAQERGSGPMTDAPAQAGTPALVRGVAEPPPERAPARAGRFQKLLLVAAVANAIIAAVTARPTSSPTVAAAPRRLAVLPFQVRGAPGFDFLRDGLVELISAGIGGDGISRVPPTTVFGRVDRGEEAGSPAQRARLARDLGADLVLAGEVTVKGDTMRISAALFDGRKPERPVRRVEVSGGTAEVPALAQRLALAVNPASRAHTPSPTAAPSLPALKLYITGQRLLKRHQYDSARAAFAGATREDPNYALAHFGLVMASEASNRPAEADAAAARAMALGGELPERERNLLVARDAYRAGDAASAEQAARAVIARDGHDVDAWAILGETELRLNPLRGRPAAEARQAFEVVLALEPARREAAFHLAELAAMRRDWATVVKLGRSMLSAETDSRRSAQLRVLTRAGEAGGAVDSSSIRTIVVGADDGMAFGVARTLAVVLRDLPAAIAVLRPIEERARTPAARAYAALLVAQLELARGRWRAAETELARARRIDALRAANYEALLVTAPGLPHDRGRLRTARRHLADAAAQPVPINADPPDWAAPEAELAGLLYPYLDGRLGALLGDGTALARVAELNAAGENGSLAEHYALIVRAALDPAADPLPSGGGGVAPDRAVLSPFYSLPEARFTHAERLARSGELELANAWFASLEELSIPDLVFGAPAHLRQAQIARALGRPREAALHYQAFLSLWKDADAELQPLVRSAERSFATLARR